MDKKVVSSYRSTRMLNTWGFSWFRRLFKGSSPGRSLPAALITVAVGSILMTPFLSFVSSRSLGTGAVGETFNEQYAADAGVEFGAWSLLNNPAFRSQVDLNAGVPQALSFPGSINGSTPTISVTGLPLGNWEIRQSAPTTFDRGGALAYAGGDRVYALQGDNTRDFGYYSISGDSWTSLTNAPANVRQGGALVHGGGNYLYALQGNGQRDFWRYNISANSWASMDDTPAAVRQGGALVFTGGNAIFAFRGNNNDFWRYNISSDSWDSRTDAPESTAYGADLVHPGGNFIYAFRGANRTDFWRFSISGNSWSLMQDAPGNVTNGGALAYHSGSYIYALQGNGTGFWRYTISGDSWTSLTDTPASVGRGGDLEFTHTEGGYAARGGNQVDFWEFEVTPPRYDISSLAGSVTTDIRLEIDGSTNTILFWDID